MKKRAFNQNSKWNLANFPFDDSELTLPVQEKAVEIANKLYEEGIPEGDALFKRAISEAKEWFLEMEG